MESQVIPFIVPLSNENSIIPDSMLVCLLNSQSILELLCPADLMKDCFIYITDKSNKLIMKYNYKGKLLSNTEQGISRAKINNINTAVISAVNSSSGLRITAGIPEGIFTGRIEAVTQLLRIFFILSIVLGLFVSLLFSYRSSIPVRKLLKTVSSVTSPPQVKENAYEYINKVLIELKTNGESYINEIGALGNSIRISLFDKLLKDPAGLQEEMREYDKYLAFLKGDYILAVLIFNNFEAIKESTNIGQFSELVKVISSDILKRLLPEDSYIHNIIPGRVVVLIPLDKDDVKTPEFNKASFAVVAYEIQKSTSIEVKIGISIPNSGYKGLHLSYVQASDVLRIADDRDNETVYIYSEENKTVPWFIFNLKDVQRMYELLLSGEEEQVIKIINGVYESVLAKKSVNDNIIRRLYYNIQNVILCASKDLIRESEEIPDFGEYSDEKSIKQLFDQLKENSRILCGFVSKRKKSKNNKLKEDIIAYLESTFTDTNLCAASAAEKYIFTFVKEQTGKSFGDLLEAIRLEKALKLLQETERSVADIAVASGFGSQNTFFKVFKRVYGVSPGVWREGNRKL